MANHYVPEAPTFNAGVRKFETTDRNHADTLNVPIAQLVENDNYLKKELEKKANQDEQNKIYTVSELSGQSLKNAKMYFVKVQRGQTVTQIGQYSIFKENNAQITSLKGNTNTDKVYSLYFDSSKNGFFLRASATGTAAADHVLAGKTFSSETDTDQTGTMINRGNWGATLDSAGQIVVPNGYHDGTGIVKANTISGRTIMPGQNEQLVIEAGKLATGDIRVSGDSNLSPDNIRHGSNIFGTNGIFTSDATAETYHLQEGKTAYVRGQKIIGTQPWRGNQIESVTPSRQSQRVSIQGGIHRGGGYIDVVGDSDLIPANIRSGTNLFGVQGNYDGGRSQIANALTNKGVPTSTSATAEQIVEKINEIFSVKTINTWDDGSKIYSINSEGSIKNRNRIYPALRGNGKNYVHKDDLGETYNLNISVDILCIDLGVFDISDFTYINIPEFGQNSGSGTNFISCSPIFEKQSFSSQEFEDAKAVRTEYDYGSYNTYYYKKRHGIDAIYVPDTGSGRILKVPSMQKARGHWFLIIGKTISGTNLQGVITFF